MNFQTMDYFVAVAEEKSFTKAAERLSVTQQTLSANIAAAEKELGSKLLERTVPLSLTFAGEELVTDVLHDHIGLLAPHAKHGKTQDSPAPTPTLQKKLTPSAPA